MLRKIISSPTVEPVSLDEMYHHASADDDHEIYIAGLIPRARKRFEKRTGRLLVKQTWEFALPKFPHCIELPYAPLRSVNHIKYINKLGQLVTLDPSEYRITEHGLTARISPKIGGSWPALGFKLVDSVQIECEFGHVIPKEDGKTIDLDNQIDADNYNLSKQAIMVLLADWFRNREDTAPVHLYDVPNAFKALCTELAVEL